MVSMFRNTEVLTRSFIETIGSKLRQMYARENKSKSEIAEAYDELDMCLTNFREAPGKFREYWSIRITAAEARINVLLKDYKDSNGR